MENLKSFFSQLTFITKLQFDSVFIWLTVLSLLTFILSLLLLPYLIRRIPSDYFLKLSTNPPRISQYDVKFLFFFLLRNVFGLLLLVSGIAMLFLPGQGLITIFLSLLLIDFPWKRQFISYLINQDKIQNSINWIRKKAKKPPIDWPSKRE